MAGSCHLIPSPDGFTSGMIAYFDCQAQNLGAQGYAALAAPGSSVSMLLTSLLTIFVAIIGYRMLVGSAPTLRESVLAFVKIGLVLAFATNWPAYQTVIYDVVLRAPAQIAAEIGAPAGLPGSTGGLPSRLDGVDYAFKYLSVYGVGAPAFNQAGALIVPPLFAGFDTFALGSARVLFITSAVGGLALVRLAAGLLLALGPLFIAFFLFEGTRGLFLGWLRALIGTALGSVAAAIVLGVELAIFEPWLGDLTARRASGGSIAGVPEPLLATAAIFALVLGALLIVIGRIAFSLKWPHTAIVFPGFGRSAGDQAMAARPAHSASVPIESRSRAAAIADHIANAERREVRETGQAAVRTVSIRPAHGAYRSGTPDAMRYTPLGQTVRRRTSVRTSLSASRRDRHL